MSYWGNRKPDFGLRCGIDWGHPLARGLVGCWLFNEGAGTTAIDLAGRNTANWSATPARGPEGVVTSAHYILPPNIYDFSNGFTIAARAMNTGAGGAFHHIAGRWGSWGLALNTSPSDGDIGLRGQVRVAASYYQMRCIPRTAFVFSKWYSVAVTWNKLVGVGYNAGQIFESLSAAGNMGIEGTQCIGAYGAAPTNAEHQWAGSISYIHLHNRALSAAEVAWLYAEPYAMIQAPEMPVFYSIPAGGSSIAAIRYHYERLRMSA